MAPFGSVEFSSDVTPEELFTFFNQINAHLAGSGIKKIIIRNPPQAYQPEQAALTEALLIGAGFSISKAEINTSLDIGSTAFEERIDKWEIRKLNQARKASLEFESVPLEKLKEIYQFIISCREERGQSLSMSLPQLEKAIAACSQNFFLFKIMHEKSIVAAAVIIKVSDLIVYNFYSAHARQADSLSPVVFLIEQLYLWCGENNLSLLDLGTSALGEVPNFTLLDFKLRMGGVPSVRYTFEKSLS